MVKLETIKEVLVVHGLKAPSKDTIDEGLSSEVWETEDYWIGLGWSEGFLSLTFCDADDYEQFVIRTTDELRGYAIDFEPDFRSDFYMSVNGLKNDLEIAIITEDH